jgi:hypothetical protein
MRVNVYAEEMTDQVEIISKEIDGQEFTGCRFYLHLPVTDPNTGEQRKGPFIHRPGDDDSSAVTFWGKRDLRRVLREAINRLDKHYGTITNAIDDVISERIRQEDEEGWTHEHDDQHDSGELASAAAAYCLYPIKDPGRLSYEDIGSIPAEWPWDQGWWKPKDRRRDLVRAAALIIAEIERLDRMEKATHEQQKSHSS